MLPYHGKIGLYVFVLSVLGATAIISTQEPDAGNVWFSLVAYYIFINIVVFAVFSDYAYQIAVRAAFLAWAFAIGLCILSFGGHGWATFGLYVCFMSFFHWSEFVTIAATNPKTLSVDSFILNHSAAYGIAAVASWLEFAVEWYFFPTAKYDYCLPVTVAGAALCAGGELLRKTAMLTARTSFTHVVQSVREDDHRLVTTGVYALCRHPSYVGWFYWSLGTQLVLVNPVCTVGYLVASWRFFNERVLVEEATLLTFFGEDYYHYQQRVPTGLPAIHGYKLSGDPAADSAEAVSVSVSGARTGAAAAADGGRDTAVGHIRLRRQRPRPRPHSLPAPAATGTPPSTPRGLAATC